MVPVRHPGRDYALGLVVLLCVEVFLWKSLGMPGLFTLGWVYGAMLVFLWHRGGGFGKIVAAVIHLPIVLRFLLPKHLRDAVSALPAAPPLSNDPD